MVAAKYNETIDIISNKWPDGSFGCEKFEWKIYLYGITVFYDGNGL